MSEPIFDEEFEEYRKLHPLFDPVLDALTDETTPFPPTFLHRFSDLTENDLGKLKRIWNDVSLVRRRTLLEDLEDLIESDTLVSFAALGHYVLHDEDPHCRAMGIRLLWEEEDNSNALVFLDLFSQDPDPEVRATAANGLGYYVYIGELEEIPRSLLTEIENALLASFVKEEPVEVRRRALESLGYSSRPEVPALIGRAVKENTPDWVASALFAIGRSADQSWEKVVLEKLSSNYPTVRFEAARAAGELELHTTVDQLLRMAVDDEEDETRYAAWWSLSQIGGENVREVLEEILDKSTDDEESQLLEDALENLSFTEDVGLFDLIDYDAEQDELIEEDPATDEDTSTKKKNHRKKGKGA